MPMCLTSKNMKFSLAFIAIGTCSACAHTLKLRSEPPGASVRAELPNGRPGAQLGKTPLDLPLPKDGKSFAVIITLDEYETKAIFIPVTDATEIEMSTTLKKIDEKYFSEKFQSSRANALSNQFAELLKLQNAIIERKFALVDQFEKAMKERFESVSIWNSLMGNSYLLRGNKEAAKKYYQRALQLDPENTEAKMLLKGG